MDDCKDKLWVKGFQVVTVKDKKYAGSAKKLEKRFKKVLIFRW